MVSSKIVHNLNIILATGLITHLSTCEKSILPRMAIYGTEEALNQVHRKKAEEWLQEWYPEVLGDIERESRVMIKNIPSIEYQLPPDEGGKPIDGPAARITAIYQRENNTIYLDGQNVMLPERRNMYLNYGCYGHCFNLWDTLKHELAHVITSEIATAHNVTPLRNENNIKERLKRRYENKDNFNSLLSDLSSDTEIQQLMVEKIVGEGIARYFEQGPFVKRKNDLPFPKSLEVFVKNPSFPYHFGHQLVTPIIKEHKAPGLTYLIIHPPNGVNDFEGYQAQALSQLAEDKKEKYQ